MLNHPKLRIDLNDSLYQAEISKKKSEILEHLKRALSYSSALDYQRGEEILKKN